MLEWIPVVLGSALAFVFVRRAVSDWLLWSLLVASAAASAFLTGELFDAPTLMAVDALLVAAGFAGTRFLLSHYSRRANAPIPRPQ